MKRRLNAAMRVWTRASLFGHPHLTGLLRARRERPRRRRAAQQRDELAASCMSGKEHCEG